MSLQSMLRGLTDAEVEFVVIGGVAAVAHGSTLQIKDFDVFYRPSAVKRRELARLLRERDRALPRLLHKPRVLEPTGVSSAKSGESL